MLVNGKWTEDWQPVQAKDEKGGFVRQTSSFRNWITPDGGPGPTGEGGFPAEAGRYHLHVALICPWASRTLIARKLKGLERAISVAVVEPELTAQGWKLAAGTPVAGSLPPGGATYLHELYTAADPSFTGRATVPVLWDKERGTIVNNESADILRILNSGFGDLAEKALDLYPEPLRPEIDRLNAALYERLNNGVYRAGFATSQAAYDEAVLSLFETLDWLEARLEGQRYLCADQLTEADWRLFTTLIRFDAVYHFHFKCNLKRIRDYPRLHALMMRLYELPGIAETVNLEHIKGHYFASHKTINPTGIIPRGPLTPF